MNPREIDYLCQVALDELRHPEVTATSVYMKSLSIATKHHRRQLDFMRLAAQMENTTISVSSSVLGHNVTIRSARSLLATLTEQSTWARTRRKKRKKKRGSEPSISTAANDPDADIAFRFKESVRKTLTAEEAIGDTHTVQKQAKSDKFLASFKHEQREKETFPLIEAHTTSCYAVATGLELIDLSTIQTGSHSRKSSSAAQTDKIRLDLFRQDVFESQAGGKKNQAHKTGLRHSAEVRVDGIEVIRGTLQKPLNRQIQIKGHISPARKGSANGYLIHSPIPVFDIPLQEGSTVLVAPMATMSLNEAAKHQCGDILTPAGLEIRPSKDCPEDTAINPLTISYHDPFSCSSSNMGILPSSSSSSSSSQPEEGTFALRQQVLLTKQGSDTVSKGQRQTDGKTDGKNAVNNAALLLDVVPDSLFVQSHADDRATHIVGKGTLLENDNGPISSIRDFSIQFPEDLGLSRIGYSQFDCIRIQHAPCIFRANGQLIAGVWNE